MTDMNSSTGAERPARSRGARVVRTGALALSALALAATSACGGAGASSESGEVVELTYWSWTKGSAEAVEAFNKSHDDIQVNFEEIPSGTDGGYSKISDAMKAGNGPDIFNAEYVALPSFVAAGNVADITEKVDEDTLKGYDEQAVELATLGDKLWAVPYDVGVQTMFYRKDLFQKYGIEVPKTWDEFAAAARKVAKEQPGVKLANLTVDDPANLEAMTQQAGAQWFSTSGDAWKLGFNDEGTQKVEKYWQGLADDKALSTAASWSTGFNAEASKGKVLTMLLASWQAAYQADTFPDHSGKWGVAPMPSWDGQPASGVFGGSTYAVSKEAADVDAAVEFSTWMTSNEDAIAPRMGDGTSSAYVVNKDAREVAKASFKADYYGDLDVYGIFEESASGLQPVTFGPTMLSMNKTLGDELKKFGHGGTLADAIGAAEASAQREMSGLGLNVKAQD
jgi:multiple sugar transport system substrate-binding protein